VAGDAAAAASSHFTHRDLGETQCMGNLKRREKRSVEIKLAKI
jgi:hypothetical protein